MRLFDVSATSFNGEEIGVRKRLQLVGRDLVQDSSQVHIWTVRGGLALVRDIEISAFGELISKCNVLNDRDHAGP